MEHPLFPGEVTGKVPLLTLTGTKELHIEQHQGLLSYQTDHAVFRTACGVLSVKGDKLIFSRYSADDAVLTGRIDSIMFDTQSGDPA